MTSPEGRLRCGRTLRVRPCNPSSSDQFQLRCLSDSILPPHVEDPSSSRRRRSAARIYAFPLLFLSAQLSLPRSGLTSCAFVHMTHRPSSRWDISHLFSFFFYLSTFCTYLSPLPPSAAVRLPIFDSFDPETRRASFCMGNRLTYKARCLRANCFYL